MISPSNQPNHETPGDNRAMVELLLHSPIRNPETNRPVRDYFYAGKADRIIRHNGFLYVVDFKTSSDAMKYLREKEIGLQGELYALAAEAMGLPPIDGIRFLVVEKPGIKLLSGSKNKAPETPEQYKARCIEWLTDPTKQHVVEKEILFTPERREIAKQALYMVTKRIAEARRTGVYLQNENACHIYGRACEFFALCRAKNHAQDVDRIKREYYKEREKQHAELDDLPAVEAARYAGKTAITYSSMTLFSSCEMRYRWRHEDRLEKIEEEESEALHLGNMFHHAMEAAATTEDWEASLRDFVAERDYSIDEKSGRKLDQDCSKVAAMATVVIAKWPWLVDNQPADEAVKPSIDGDLDHEDALENVDMFAGFDDESSANPQGFDELGF